MRGFSGGPGTARLPAGKVNYRTGVPEAGDIDCEQWAARSLVDFEAIRFPHALTLVITLINARELGRVGLYVFAVCAAGHASFDRLVSNDALDLEVYEAVRLDQYTALRPGLYLAAGIIAKVLCLKLCPSYFGSSVRVDIPGLIVAVQN